MKTLTRNYLQRTALNIFTFGYGMPKDARDMFGTLGGSEYFETKKGDVYQVTKDDRNKFILIYKIK